jgi:hypothetical protein
MAANTKKLVQLSARNIGTARTWFSFVGDIAEVDRVVMRLICSSNPIVVSDRECSVFMRWWTYLPSSLIEDRDRDLYDTVRDFLYTN